MIRKSSHLLELLENSSERGMRRGYVGLKTATRSS